MQTLPAQALFARTGVGVTGVASIDDDVALLQQGGEGVDRRVGRGAGLDHDDDPARAGEGGDEFLERFGWDERPLVAVGLEGLAGVVGEHVVA